MKTTKLNRIFPVPSDIEIVRAHQCLPIYDIATGLGLANYEPYGNYMAKVWMKNADFSNTQAKGNYVVVTGMTPTSLGEGKSTTAIGLGQALGAWLDKKCIVCIRQPSQGPTFGLKGGAAGGGYSQVMPMENFNLHLTGDIHAVTAAHNLIAAAIDARIFHEATQSDKGLYSRLVPSKPGKLRKFNKAQKARLVKLGIPEDIEPANLTDEQKRKFSRLDIDPKSVNWTRVTDTNDRFLRLVTIGQSPSEKGFERQTQFDVSVASELMAILSLCNDIKDAKERIRNIVIGFSKHNPLEPITCDDLGISGAVAVLLKDALKPTLIQTLEGTPVLVHCGPFANIAHGNSSIIADRFALKLVGEDGYVVTEAGFGADVGFEKFIHIKCRSSGLMPNCAVIVSTIRALKSHGGAPSFSSGDKMPEEYLTENLPLLEKGLCNLEAHLRNLKEQFEVPTVVAINRFSTDSEKELEMVKSRSIQAGAFDACIADNYKLGGEGALDLAEAVIKACKVGKQGGRFLYELDLPIKDKIECIAKRIYGASRVQYSDIANHKIERYEQLGYKKFPICIAKTQYSFSHDPSLKGAPKDFVFPIIDVRVSTGAGFVYPLAGEIKTILGLPTRPAFFDIDIDSETEDIEGLY